MRKKNKPAPRSDSGTNRAKLRRMSAAHIRKGIAADPDAHATDGGFWKSAKVVLPAR